MSQQDEKDGGSVTRQETVRARMNRPRIYTDFNGPFQPTQMLLSYVGSLRDLNVQKVVLKEGLPVTVYSDSDDEEDIEMDGVVCFGRLPTPENQECWYVRTEPDSLRLVKVEREQGRVSIPCFRCGCEIYDSLRKGHCPSCGFDVEYARRR